MRNKEFKYKKLLVLSLLFFLLATPAVAQNNNSNNNNNNPGQEGRTGNPGTSNNNSNNNNNSNSQGNPGNNNPGRNNTNNPGVEGNPGNNTPQNNNSKNSQSNQKGSIQSIRAQVSNNQVLKFGDEDKNEVSQTTSSVDSDVNDDVQFIKTGSVKDITKDDNSFVLDDEEFSLTPELFSFLVDNGLITDGARVQIKINKASGSSNNVVEHLRIFSEDGRPDLMVKLHTNNQVSQLTVRANPTTSTSGGPLSGVLTTILSFINSIFGGDGGTSPSPSPTSSPTASPTASPDTDDGII